MSLPDDLQNSMYEIRIRLGCPIYVKTFLGNYFLSNVKKSTIYDSDLKKITKEEIVSTLSLLTLNSLHAFENELNNGYLTIEGGCRIGIGGESIYYKGEFRGFKNISSINIRIAKEQIGCGNKFLKYIIKDSNSIYNTLITGPPLAGKTTCIRDITRLLSDGTSIPKYNGCDVTVVDERGEISGIFEGIPQMNIGNRTDVLAYCKKKDGFIMGLRSLAPQIIISDELGDIDDFNVVQYALKSGVKIISSAHCSSMDDVINNIYLKKIIKHGFFERVIILDEKIIGNIKQVYDNENSRYMYGGNN